MVSRGRRCPGQVAIPVDLSRSPRSPFHHRLLDSYPRTASRSQRAVSQTRRRSVAREWRPGMKRSGLLPELLQSYFRHWLANQRNVSHHTIVSYRDSWRLFLRFIAQHLKRDVAKLDTADLTAQRVVEFLDDAERTRQVKISTRNCRLAAIKGFFSFVADRDPTLGAQCAAVLRIPMKRGPKQDPCSMDRDGTEAALAHPDHASELGLRDRALLAVSFNTGARISEVLAVSTQDLRFESPFQVRLFGQSRKERICSLSPATVNLLEVPLSQQQL